MHVEHFPAGVPVTTLAVELDAVGALADDRFAVIVHACHCPKPIPLSLDLADAKSLLRCLTAAVDDHEARRSNSN